MLTAHLGFRVVQTAGVLPRHPQLVLAAAVLRPEHYHGQCPALGLAESLVHPRLPHERKHVRHADPDGKRRFGIFRETSHVSYVAVGCAANELGNAFEVSGAEWSVGGVIVGGNEGIELSVWPDAVENHLLFERGKNIYCRLRASGTNFRSYRKIPFGVAIGDSRRPPARLPRRALSFCRMGDW